MTTTSASAAIFTWTGADGATDATWQNPLNWDGGSVPNGVAGQLSTASALDVVIFDAETAAFMPSDSILTRNSFTGSFKNPQIDLRNGTLNISGSRNWGWSGITTLIVGDGDLTTTATANLTWGLLNRDPNGLKTYVVNADGALNVSTNLTFSDGSAKDTAIQLNGGSFTVDGQIVANLTNDSDDLISFNAVGSTFTAEFGGQFLTPTDVSDQFGDSLVDTTGSGLTVTDNLDNTFTVTVVPEPGSLALLGLGGLCVLRRRRA